MNFFIKLKKNKIKSINKFCLVIELKKKLKFQ